MVKTSLTERSNPDDRKLGKYWEEQFLTTILPFGFSGDSKSHGIRDDKMIWRSDGESIYIQIRHKDSYFLNKELRHCYGYEKYRLDKDVRIIQTKEISGLYVVHDYTHWGKYSQINRIEDWYAAGLIYLQNSIDEEKVGSTWFGGDMTYLPICYWQLPKFKPLLEILESLNKQSAQA